MNDSMPELVNIEENGTRDEEVPLTEAVLNFLNRSEHVLRDEVTMLGFKVAIEANAQRFQGATVLDLGCGIGLLSLWAAQQGARRIIAVDATEACQLARHMVKLNSLEHVIQVVEGDVEELQELPVDQVDIILCMWMGACLMFNSMLEKVIYARDRWLKPGGIIFPSIANLYMVAADQPRDPTQPLRRSLGLNLGHADSIVEKTPLVSCIAASQVVTQRQLLRHIDIRTLQLQDLSFNVVFQLHTLRQSLAKYFVLYFDFKFPVPVPLPAKFKRQIITSSPSALPTQWKQTLFQIDKHLPICVDDVIHGIFRVVRGEKHLDFDIVWGCRNHLVDIEVHKQIYRMQGQPKIT